MFMKKKRIILHICILALAIICMVAGLYVAEFLMKKYNNNDTEVYNSDYSYDVISILEFCGANREYREKYMDDSQILIENKNFGNVTVADIKNIFKDKYSEFYEMENGFYSFDEFSDYMYLDEDGNYSREKTLYDKDVDEKNAAEQLWNEHTTKDNWEKYQYYSKKCGYVEEYAELINTLMQRVINEGGDKSKYNDESYLLNETYPEVNSGMLYFVSYNLEGKTYQISNVGSEEFFANSENSLLDMTTLENEVLVQAKPAFGEKYISEKVSSDRQISLLKNANKIYVAIGGTDETTYYYDFVSRIQNQISDEELGEMQRNTIICCFIMAITLLVGFTLYIMLMLMAGHKTKGDVAMLASSDRLWWDVEIILGIIVFAIVYSIAAEWYDSRYYKIFGRIIAFVSVPLVEYFVLMSESLLRRLKTKSFMKTTLFGKVCYLIKVLIAKTKKLIKMVVKNLSLSLKVLVLAVIMFLLLLYTMIMSWNSDVEEPIILGVLVIGVVCYIVWKYFAEVQVIEEGAKEISEGNINYKIEDNMKFGANEALKDIINGIGDGLSSAVESDLKNERMKTELITNVSHDLKTPLTSIINYVDLLKTEGLDSENAEKYLKVLDQKSQRLKQLTEDLVEASKLNSGAVKLQLEKIDIVQLVNQSLGEFDEKFKMKSLEIVETIKEEPIWVMADGRKTWRLFDNLYNNINKYAMPGTRVYIDIRREANKVKVSLKNISEQPLNFSADELMERFVRGDVARTTEGSGLGLSIARSIAERQNGQMNIILDGDLFKVEIIMDISK